MAARGFLFVQITVYGDQPAVFFFNPLSLSPSFSLSLCVKPEILEGLVRKDSSSPALKTNGTDDHKKLRVCFPVATAAIAATVTSGGDWELKRYEEAAAFRLSDVLDIASHFLEDLAADTQGEALLGRPLTVVEHVLHHLCWKAVSRTCHPGPQNDCGFKIGSPR